MLYYTYVPFERVDTAIRAAIKRDRGLTYDAAMDAIRGIADPLLRRGKQEFTLTIQQLRSRGHSERASRNAIKLLSETVLEETGETVVLSRSRPMRVFRFREGFLVNKVPSNQTELEEAVVRSGGKSAVLSAVKSHLQKEHPGATITTRMLYDRYVELQQRTIERQSRSVYFSGKRGL